MSITKPSDVVFHKRVVALGFQKCSGKWELGQWILKIH